MEMASLPQKTPAPTLAPMTWFSGEIRRAPDEIVRSGGFQPRAPGSGTSLAGFAANNTASDYVSTSRLESVAEGFAGRGGYVYGISTDGLPMIDEFRRVNSSVDPTGTGLRWTIGNALEVLADDSSFDELAGLARDRRYGKARQMLVLGLGKSKRPEAVEVLVGLMDDPEVDGQAVMALGKLRTPLARAALESKRDDKRAWVRREARKALGRLP